MSKSLGNLVFVSELREKIDPMVIRLALLDHHYRGEWEWSDAEETRALQRFGRWRDAARGGIDDAVTDPVRAALDDDLDTPAALVVIDEAADRGADVSAAANLLGVDLETVGA